MTDVKVGDVSLAAEVPETKSRSLWATAFLRLRRNRLAMASLGVLIFYVLAGIFGPMVTNHDYREQYQEFAKLPPSLEAYPYGADVIAVAEKALARVRGVEIGEMQIDGNRLLVPMSAEEEIDPRFTRYLDRSDLFQNTVIAESSEGGSEVVMAAEIERLYFFFGTDGNGRDLLARTLISIRISLMIGVLAAGVALVIGVAYGATAGFIGGRVDNFMMRIVDVLYSLPFIFFVILLVVFFGRSIALMFIAVGCVEWLDMARIVRGQTLSLKNREFVQAAEALGVRSTGILRRHIIPNTLGPVIIYLTLLIPRIILLESFLSFLGLGVQAPLTSLGVMISDGAKNLQGDTYLLFFPAAALTILLFALNFLGDGLRDALDPKDR